MSGKPSCRHRYYVCYEHSGKQPYFRAELVEAAFTSILARLVASPELQRTYRSPKILGSALREHVRDLEKALGDLDDRRRNVLGHAEALPVSAGVKLTHPAVTFVGEGDGHFDALATRTGERLWQFQTGAGVNAAPMAFALDGREYVAVASGGNAQFGTPPGDVVFVFALQR